MATYGEYELLQTCEACPEQYDVIRDNQCVGYLRLRHGFVQGAFGRACKRAGIVGITPHTLRHTCGTWMAQQRVSLRMIGEYLGHSDDERTTRLYAHHHPDYQDEAVAAFNRRR